MSDSKTAITNAVLLTLFPKLQRLGQYLVTNLHGQLTVVCSNDSTEYRKLLHDTLVGPTPAASLEAGGVHATSFPTENAPWPEGSQNFIVDIAIEQTCPPTRSWFDGKYNILATGYKNPRRIAGQKAQKYHENTLQLFVRSAHWETLLRRIGQRAMLYLLTQTSIFAALPNNCYCQITGPAISEQAFSKQHLQPQLLQNLSSRKRPAHSTASPAATDLCPSTDLSAPAAKRRALSKEKRKLDGDTLETALKRAKKWKTEGAGMEGGDKDKGKGKAEDKGKGKAEDKDKGKVEDKIPDISPSAILFKRSKIFYSKQYQTESTMLRHFLLADYDISQKAVTPPDQKSAVDALMKQMFPKQHGLANVFSPTQSITATPFSGTLSYSSLSSSAFKQKGGGSSSRKKKATGNWRLRSMRGLVKEMLILNQKCRFKPLLQYYCPVKALDNESESSETDVASHLTSFSTFDQVVSFVHAIVKKVIPLAMFGSTNNRTVILRAMTRFIQLRKFETMPLQYVLQGFKLSDCAWLQDSRLDQEGSKVCHTPPTASDKQHEILYEFVYWLVDGFLIPLLQGSFYVTDSSYQRNKVFYYRHGLWKLITRSAVNSLQENMFVRMEPVSGGLAISYKSMNQRLNNAFLILAYERSRQMVSSSAVGMSDLFFRLKQVKEKLVGSSKSDLPRLYMVKVDIKKSFDSINQENLLETIDRTLKEKKYIIYRHSKVMPANGKMMRRFLPKAIAPDEMPSFLDFAHEQAEISRHAVLVDKVVHTDESKDVVINLIKDHVQENIVKFGRHFYKQKTGIPQGSVLSPALCSQRVDKATEFLQIMSDGQPEFGCFINENKTIANFPVSLNGRSVHQSQGNDFPYCGLLLHSKTLEIRADYSRYIDEDIRNLLTVARDLHPGRSIILKMKKAMQHMCQMAFSDTTYNSHPKVLLNIYQNFIFCAMKFHAYVQELFLDSLSTTTTTTSSSSSSTPNNHIIDPKALPAIVSGIFRAGYGLLHNGRRSTVGITAGVQFQVNERHVHWLGASAFLKTLPGPSAPHSPSSSSYSSLPSDQQGQGQGQRQSSSRLPGHIYAPLKTYLKTEIVDRLDIDEKKVHFRRILHSTVHDPRNDILDKIRYK
ncbi:hypothetical protein BGX33_010303 [Mortierella sp. NVP41]|nr:hypothetical protein BGX33_010303 [Mortierella sp. NVP41]